MAAAVDAGAVRALKLGSDATGLGTGGGFEYAQLAGGFLGVVQHLAAA